MSNIQYTYVKNRSQFGKWCNFSEQDKLEVDINPDKTLMHEYIRIDPMTQGTQCGKNYSVHEVMKI